MIVSRNSVFFIVNVLILILNFIPGIIMSLKSSVPPGILVPQDSETRCVKSLDGIWNFRVCPRDDPDYCFHRKWFEHPLHKTGKVDLMPVPSSYNDITQSRELRDFIGWVWYDRKFFISKAWVVERKHRIFLRIGSVCHHAIIYINGEEVVEHAGGSLPFLVELSVASLKIEQQNWITIAVNNTLTPTTIPQGEIVWNTDDRYPPGSFEQVTGFDFFNYAGIHRSVLLYTTPRTYIDDIDVITRIEGSTGYLSYSVKTFGDGDEDGVLIENAGIVSVHLEDKLGVIVASGSGHFGELVVPNAKFWWPYTMVNESQSIYEIGAGYQYTLVVKVVDTFTHEHDVYRLKVGIRTVSWSKTGFYINEKPFYFRGVGRHEDVDIRGKGTDIAMIVKDHNIMKWLGVNSFRTSHYPYAEEIMDICDELGIVIVEECASDALRGFGPELLKNNKKYLKDMIQRDKNRPSVVMWSMGNEPDVTDINSQAYFRELIAYTKELDETGRPCTIVSPGGVTYDKDYTAELVDIISINRYYGFYDDAGHLEVVTKSVIQDVETWVGYYHKPLLVMEYSVAAIAGIHRVPSFIWTEEYLQEAMQQYFKAFDHLRAKGVPLIGEMIWNFADFMSKQEFYRVDGNKMGILTRERNPKMAAHYLRYRYFLLANKLNGFPVPEDLQKYIPLYV